VSTQGVRRSRRVAAWLRSALLGLRSGLLGLVCLAVVAADSNATTLCIDADGSAAIEIAYDGRCSGCDDDAFPPLQAEARPRSELRGASCQGCLDVDIAGIERAARRDLDLASLTIPWVAPALISALPCAPASVACTRRLERPLDARSASLARTRVLRC